MPKTFRFPLRAERHTHVSLYAALADCPSLAGLEAPAAMALLQGLPGDRLSVVKGWHSARQPLSPGELRELPPALILNLSLHGFLLTPSARGPVRDQAPELLEVAEDPESCERSLPSLLGVYGRLAGLTEAKLQTFMANLEAQGLCEAEELLLTDAAALGVMRASPLAGRLRAWASPELFRELSDSDRRWVVGLKLFTDGALGTRTAALSAPYRDGGTGLLLHTDDAWCERLVSLHGFGKPLAIHAIGDRAIEQALSGLECLDREGLHFPSLRLEHAQLITETQARRAKALGITLSMQPNFSSDSVDYADRLEPRHLAANNPFRMLIDRCGFQPGVDLIFGTDGMPHGVEYTLQWNLFPAFPGQRLSLEEYLAGTEPRSAQGECSVAIDEAGRKVTLA